MAPTALIHAENSNQHPTAAAFLRRNCEIPTELFFIFHVGEEKFFGGIK